MAPHHQSILHHLQFPASTTWPYGREGGVEPSGVRSSTPTSIPYILICTHREGSRVGAGKRMVEGPPATAIQLTRTLIVPYGRFAYGSRVLDREAVPLRHAAASGPDAFTVIGIDHFSTKNGLRSLSNDIDLDNVVYSVAAKPPRGSQRSCPRSWHSPLATTIESQLAPECARDRSLHAF